MYGTEDVPVATQSEAERDDPHPLLAAYQAHCTSKCMARDEVREAVIPTYMGLITQIDNQIGVLIVKRIGEHLVEGKDAPNAGKMIGDWQGAR